MGWINVSQRVFHIAWLTQGCSDCCLCRLHCSLRAVRHAIQTVKTSLLFIGWCLLPPPPLVHQDAGRDNSGDLSEPNSWVWFRPTHQVFFQMDTQTPCRRRLQPLIHYGHTRPTSNQPSLSATWHFPNGLHAWRWHQTVTSTQAPVKTSRHSRGRLKMRGRGVWHQRRRWRASGATKRGRGWRRGVNVKLVGGLKERGGNVSVWLKREIDAGGRSGVEGWVVLMVVWRANRGWISNFCLAIWLSMRKTELKMKKLQRCNGPRGLRGYAGWKMHKTMLHIKKYDSDSSERI